MNYKNSQQSELGHQRPLMTISWTERKAIQWILEKANEKVKDRLLSTIRKRKMKFVGHALASNDIGKDLLMAAAYGKRGRG